MKMLTSQNIKNFQTKILDWYLVHQRVLPWRRDRDPYHILISEIMLQQTQVSRVIPKYEAWLKRFPTVEDLAKAPVSEVLKYWSGLGYNRRALNLKKTAEIIAKEYNRKFPKDEKQLKSLPGIGEYTARALLCFAFDKQVAVVDTNVRKVILTEIIKEARIMKQESRKDEKSHDLCFLLHDSSQTETLSQKDIESIAQRLLPSKKAYEWNQALMDYSSAMLKKEKIPIPKQSKFVGSHRYYRGQIIKQLLERKKIAIKDLGNLIKKDFKSSEKEWLESLILELQNEGFVKVTNGYVTFITD